MVRQADFLSLYFTRYAETSAQNENHNLLWHRFAQCLGPCEEILTIADTLITKYAFDERLGYSGLAFNILSAMKTGSKNWDKESYTKYTKKYVDLTIQMLYKKNDEFNPRKVETAIHNRDPHRDLYYGYHLEILKFKELC